VKKPKKTKPSPQKSPSPSARGISAGLRYVTALYFSRILTNERTRSPFDFSGSAEPLYRSFSLKITPDGLFWGLKNLYFSRFFTKIALYTPQTYTRKEREEKKKKYSYHKKRERKYKVYFEFNIFLKRSLFCSGFATIKEKCLRSSMQTKCHRENNGALSQNFFFFFAFFPAPQKEKG